MNLRPASHGMPALVLTCMASLFIATFAQAQENMDKGVPMPVIPMGLGDSCVEDNNFMRRNHMNLLKHQRDETMLKGVRNKQYSLKECLSCHVVNGPDAMPLTVASPQHFCRSCHDYAAVSIDCFQCHASGPDTGLSNGSHSEPGVGVAKK